ncbi:MAG: hypothetical protein BMS9Abin13_090 [Patescibacteria group bacterium]|nr:MAG: hypothetical protein BMS9Abin13_090 [Patescibacteria group bacterium]
MKRTICFGIALIFLGVMLNVNIPYGNTEKDSSAKHRCHVPPKYRSQHRKLMRKLSQGIKGEFAIDPEFVKRVLCDPRLKVYLTAKRPKGKKGVRRLKADYRKNVLSKKSVADGKEYIDAHKDYFVRAQKMYGVDPYIITAIIRAESNYGKNLGERLVINSLYRLYMVPPKTKKINWRNFALKQLKHLLHLAQKNNRDVFSIKGSWAGALGLPQFIPSSYNTYAVDGNGDGVVDLFHHPDAIMSVAHYLKENRWGKDSKRRVLLRYNNATFYVNLVLKFRKKLKAYYEKNASEAL